MFMVETHEIYIDSATGAKQLFCFHREVASKARAIATARQFNDTYDPPERAFVRTFKHGQWLRVA